MSLRVAAPVDPQYHHLGWPATTFEQMFLNKILELIRGQTKVSQRPVTKKGGMLHRATSQGRVQTMIAGSRYIANIRTDI